jgi:glutamate dehydrogenase/leucine dehydrogenase
MPTTNEAIVSIVDNKIDFLPAKAANSGGVACSALEMAQNSMRLSWSAKEVDSKLQGVMQKVFEQCASTAHELGSPGNYQLGANAAGFIKVAKAMLAQGDVVVA